MKEINPNSESYQSSDLIGLKVNYTAFGYLAKGEKNGIYEIIEAVKFTPNKFLTLCQNIETNDYVVFEASIYSFEKLPILAQGSQIIHKQHNAEKRFHTLLLNKTNVSIGNCNEG